MPVCAPIITLKISVNARLLPLLPLVARPPPSNERHCPQASATACPSLPPSSNEPERPFWGTTVRNRARPLIQRVHHSSTREILTCYPHQLSMSPDRSYNHLHHLRTSPTTYVVVSDTTAQPPPPATATTATLTIPDDNMAVPLAPSHQGRQRSQRSSATTISMTPTMW